MPHTIPVPQCPACKGDMYDNRDSKKNPKSPDFRCKDKSCLDDKGFATALWEKDIIKKGGAPAAPTNGKQAFTAGPRIDGIDAEHPARPHELVDRICAASETFFKHVLTAELPEMVKADIGATDQYVHSRVATLLITAEKAGVFR